jgi:poly(hydroxyalkanoate) granule-associated protein
MLRQESRCTSIDFYDAPCYKISVDALRHISLDYLEVMIMAKKEAEIIDERNDVFEAVRKVVLAGIGGVALAQDEIAKFLNKMVERGEIAEKDARKLLDEVTSRRKEQAKKAEKEVDTRMEELLARMNVPTKTDIEALSDKISKLTEKVEALQENGKS